MDGDLDRLNSLLSGLEMQLDSLSAEIERLERGDLRCAERAAIDEWRDRTKQALHDKRNLAAVLRALVCYLTSTNIR